MPPARPKPTLADWVTVAISPALIMTLVGSLVYFLVEVLYAGQFVGRLQWILFFFVFAIVLIARLSMGTESAGRAPLYGAILSVLVWVGLGQFVQYPPELASVSWVINAGLVGVVWWASHRLTWDCTHVDDSDRATATGLLHAAGLEGEEETEAGTSAAGEEGAEKGRAPGLWDRIREYRAARKKRHTPGVWVVYFSLAALPIFGLGQALIPAEELSRRRYAFWLMALYAASALGLLVTTAFLGLRRYLRQRGVPMPPAITATWLALGGGLALALLVVGAVLPRPSPEYSLIPFNRAGSKARDASRFAMRGGDTGRSNGQSGTEARRDPQGQAGKAPSKQPGQEGTKPGQGGNTTRGEEGSGKGDKGSGKGQGDSDKGQDGGKSPGEQSPGQGEKGDKGDKDDGRSPAPDRKDSRTDQGSPQRDPGKEGQDRPADQGRESEQAGQDRSRTGPPQPPPSTVRSLPGLDRIAGLLRWLVLLALAVAAVVFVLRGGLRFLANFFDWPRLLLEALRAFWNGLFGRAKAEDDAGEEAGDEVPPPRPFGEYSDPFRDGRADRAAVAELTRYTFEALEAWAYDQGIARMADETPLEFSGRVGGVFPSLGADAQRLGALYAQVLYAPGDPPPGAKASLRQFWERLERVKEQPLSA